MKQEQLKKKFAYNSFLGINQNDVRTELDFDKLILWQEVVRNGIASMSSRLKILELTIGEDENSESYYKLSKAITKQSELIGTIKSQIAFLKRKQSLKETVAIKFMKIAKVHLDNDLFKLIKDKAEN